MEFNFDSVRFAEAPKTEETEQVRVSAAKESRIVKYPEPMTRQQRARLKAALDREEGPPAVKTQHPGKYKAAKNWKYLQMKIHMGRGGSFRPIPVCLKLKTKVEKVKKIKRKD